MKKVVLVVIVFLIFVVSCKSSKIESSEQAFNYVKSIKNYTSDIKVTFLNDKNSEIIFLRQYASSNYGYRLDFENERKYFYRDNKIYINDVRNNIEYFVDENFDEIYKYCFLNEYIKLIYSMDEVDYFIQLIASDEKVVFGSRVDLPTNNSNISYAILYLSGENYLPLQFEIFDNKGRQRILIEYLTFDVLNDIDSKLFDY